MNKLYILLVTLIVSTISVAQTGADSLLNDLAATTTPKTDKVFNTFKSVRVINTQSVEMLAAGALDFRILHRMGMVKNGIKDLFGLDNASMRMSFDYGITKDLTVGVGRSTYKKELDALLKYRIKQQATGLKSFPISIVAVGGIVCNTLPWTDPNRKNYFSSRLAYYGQLLLARKVSNNFSVQLTPSIVHRNLVELNTDENDVVSIGFGSRVKVSKRVAIVVDASPVVFGNRKGYNTMPLAIGVDIETGGHVFQLHFTNSVGMNEKAVITETTQRWDKSEFQFGFNLSRMFTVKKNKATNF